jgi:hypothetical protein
MILDATDRGWIEGDGPYYPQARTEIRPRQLRGFRDRLYAIGMSPESVEQAARIGARLAIFSQMPWEMWAGTSLASYRTVWGATQRGPRRRYVRPPIARRRTRKRRRRACTWPYSPVLDHRAPIEELRRRPRLRCTSGSAISSIGKEDQAQGYLTVQSWGSPEKILRSLAQRREIIGDFELSVVARYGALPRRR